MRIKKKLFILCLLLIGFTSSCDIPGTIELKNRTEDRVYYQYYEKNLNGQIDTISIELFSETGQNNAILAFGNGQFWKDPRIEEYFDSIEKIELITSKDTLVLTDKKEMFNYFKDRRKGLFKQKVSIIIE